MTVLKWNMMSIKVQRFQERIYTQNTAVTGWVGVLLSPAVRALLMSLSTVIVAINAQLLRRLDLSN